MKTINFMTPTKSNLEILQEMKIEYNPKTAFGNPVLIDLMNEIKKPDDDGNFETIASVERVQICSVIWKCVDCGKRNHEDLEDDYVDEGDEIEKECECGKNHKLTIG